MAQEIKKNKSLKYLILGLAVASLVVLLKEVILKPKELSLPELPSQPSAPQFKIDFDLLKKIEAQELLPLEKLSLPEEIGRENPFQPYLESEGQ